MSKEELDEVCRIIRTIHKPALDTGQEEQLRFELICELHATFNNSFSKSLPDATGDSE